MHLTAKAEQTRDAILATGEELLLTKGFTGVGLQQILTTCGVPKGSFYHYFPSKEHFGVAVLERYVDRYLEAVGAVAAASGSGRDRLVRLAEAWAGRGPAGASADRCLVVSLSAEVAGISEPMRATLADGIDRLVGLLAAVTADGIADGSVRTPAEPRMLAQTLYELWLGAALLDRVFRDGTPFDAALASTDLLLGPLPQHP